MNFLFLRLSLLSFAFCLCSTAVQSQVTRPKIYPPKVYNTAIQDFYQVYSDENNSFFLEERALKNGLKKFFGGSEGVGYRLIKYDKNLQELFSTEYTEADMGKDYDLYKVVSIGSKMYMIVWQQANKTSIFKYALVDPGTGKPRLPFMDLASFSYAEDLKYSYFIKPTIKGDKQCIIQQKGSGAKHYYTIATLDSNGTIRTGNAATPWDKNFAYNTPELLIDNNFIYIAAKEYKPGNKKKDPEIFVDASLMQFTYTGEMKQRFIVPDSAKVPSSFAQWKIDETKDRITAAWLSNTQDLLASAEKLCIGRYQLSDAKLLDFKSVNFKGQQTPLPATPILDKKGNETGDKSFELAGRTAVMDIVEEEGKLYIPVQHRERWQQFSSSGNGSSILDNTTRTFDYEGDIAVFCFSGDLTLLWGSKVVRRQRETVFLYDRGNDLYKTAIDLNVTRNIKINAFPTMPLYGGATYVNTKGSMDFYFNEVPEGIHKKRTYNTITEMDDKSFANSNLYRFSVDKQTGDVKYQLVQRNNEEQIAMPFKTFIKSNGTLLIPSMPEKIKGPLTITFSEVTP